MSDRRVPLTGSTLIVGPSQAGKTRLTARALNAWIDTHGAAGVVVLEFAPEVEQDGTLLGGRLDRFTTVPDDAWHGILDAYAPRTAGETDAKAAALAADNANRAARLLNAAPDDPAAVFVNDATIPLQAEEIAPHRLVAYCKQASCAVLNAYEGELGTDDSVSQREYEALTALRSWVDRTRSLSVPSNS
ncbi:hypothetical protein [Halobacterium noricense]|uniref:hypothetical protein n=1 Tax=Halobacterium noricense TaxID=223182 RepID=UPI001E419341|nr:hypothetical protein [Halobacterium noricense]UHH27155.1 hypothetical protein LT974_15980 [Halobacterium noricense]